MRSSILCSLPWQNLFLGQVNIFLRYDNSNDWVDIAIEQKWYWSPLCSNSRDEREKLCQFTFFFLELRTEPRSLRLLCKYSTIELKPQPQKTEIVHMLWNTRCQCLKILFVYVSLLTPNSLQHPSKCCLCRWVLSSTVDSAVYVPGH